MKYQANRQENHAALKVTIFLMFQRWTMDRIKVTLNY